MIELLYQDPALLVCIKPVGVAAQGEEASALPSLLSTQLGQPVYPVHRLDQPVGGLMVFAKTPKAAAALSAAMQTSAFQKEYLAVLPGSVEPPAGELRDLLFYDRRRGKSFVADRPRNGVKEAVLTYETASVQGALALVRIRLQTGRTHQIRVQFASRKRPLLGDGKYGSRENKCTAALWSYRLSFPHPTTGAAMEFLAPAPSQFPWDQFPLTV